MSRLGLIWRFVRRGALLTRSQAILAIVLVALPVAGLSSVTLLLQSRTPTAAEDTQFLLGRTQSKLQVVNSPDPTLRQDSPGGVTWRVAYDEKGMPVHPVDPAKEVDPRTVLPAGTVLLRLADSRATVRTAKGEGDMAVTLGPSWDPSLTGRFDLVSGHRATADDQIMVTAAALDRLGEHVGDSVHLLRPVKRAYTISGVLHDRRSSDAEQELFLPDGAFDGTDSSPSLGDYSYYLPSLDLSTAQLHELNTQGIVGTSRAIIARYGDLEAPLQYDSRSWFPLIAMAFGFGAFEIVLLAGSALFIGARSRQRILAIVASNGASRRALVAMVASSGAAIGLIGGVVGAAAGIGIGSAVMSFVRDGSAKYFPGYHLDLGAHLGIAALAVVIGVAAALVPALAVSRVDVVSALRGATRPAKTRRRRPTAAIAVTVSGAALMLASGGAVAALNAGWLQGPGGPEFIRRHASRIIEALTWTLTASAVIMQIGLILASGLLLVLVARLSRRLSISATLATRDLDRNRSRAVPAIAAIMTTSFLVALLLGATSSSNAEQAQYYNSALRTGQVGVSIDPELGGKASASSSVASSLAAEAAGILSRDFDVSSVSTLMAVPDATQGVFAADDPTPRPAVMIPAQNLCPHLEDGHNQFSNLGQADWRCQDAFSSYDQRSDIAPTIIVGGVAELQQILGRKPSPAAVDALEGDGAVSLHRQFVDGGTMRIGWYPGDKVTDLVDVRVLEHPARSSAVSAVVQTPSGRPSGFGVVLSPAAAAKLGLTAQPLTVLATLKTAATQSQKDAATAALSALNVDGRPQLSRPEVETGPVLGFPSLVEWGLLLIGALVTLASAVVALTLARQDGARDAGVYAAVGASPAMARRLAFWQALVVVALGAILGTATAALTVYAAIGISGTSPYVMPWGPLAVTTVGLALVIAGGAWLSARPLRGTVARTAIA